MIEKNLDQFYTNPLTAKKITSIFVEKLKELDYHKINFLEPSAGTGNFLEAIREISKKILAFDIEPKSDKENIITAPRRIKLFSASAKKRNWK